MARRFYAPEAAGPLPYTEQKPAIWKRFLRWLVLTYVFLLSIPLGVLWMFWDLKDRAWPLLVSSGWARYVGGAHPLESTIRCYFRNNCSRAVYRGAYAPRYLLVGIPPLLGILLLFGANALITIRAPARSPGTARWADRKDLRSLRKGRQSGYVGFLKEKDSTGPRYPIPFPERIRNGHFAVIGGPGAGKTSAFFLPNLMRDAEEGNNAIVFDFKFPDPEGLGEALSYFWAHKRRVYTFTPFERDSMVLSLLEGGDTREGALSIAEMLVPKRPDEGGEEFYRNLERTILMALVYALSTDPKNQGVVAPKDLLLKLLAGPDKVVEYLKSHPRADVREWVAKVGENMSRLQADKKMGLFLGLASKLIVFDNARLNAATTPPPKAKEGVINLKEILTADEPFLLYIGIPQAEIQGGKGQALLQLIKRLLDRAILAAAHANHGRLKRHTVVYLDEFPSFGPLPNMTEMLATMRSRRVSYLISFQDHAQGYAVYGKEEFDAMFGTIQNLVLWPSRLSAEDRKWFMELLGETVALERSLSEASHTIPIGVHFEKRYTESLKEAKRYLLPMDEMQRFPAEEAVVLTPGIPPIRTYMPYIFSDGSDPDLLAHPWARRRKRYLKYDPMGVLTMVSLQGTQVTELMPKGEEDEVVYQSAFILWVEKLLEYLPRLSKAKPPYAWEISHLPKDVDFSPELWEKKGWAKQAGGNSIWITQEGYAKLPPRVQELLKDSAEKQPLYRYLKQYRTAIRGLAEDEGDGQYLGVLQGTAVWLAEEHVPEDLRPLAQDKKVQDGKTYLVFSLSITPKLKRDKKEA